MGQVAARNFAEMLSVDFVTLLRSLGVSVSEEMSAHLKALGFVKRMECASQVTAAHFGEQLPANIVQHASDTVRGWAAYVVATAPAHKTVLAATQAIWPFAIDSHFAVREWAWMALRPRLAAELLQALDALTPWVSEDNPNLRRFAIEALRPRGVWTQHIKALRADPSSMRPLLEPLQREPCRYVQDSVANWLNDAGKDHPKFVRDLCKRWLRDNPDDKATARICRRAQRRLAS